MDGEVETAEIAPKNAIEQVFNLEVETEHAYLVGDARVVVHSVIPCSQQGGVQANKAAGDGVRDAIAAREAAANPRASVRIDESFRLGSAQLERRLEVFVDGGGRVGFESKVGRTSLTPRVRQELARDIRLLRARRVDQIVWEFSPSGVTGLSGPTVPLLAKLRQFERLAIKVVNP